MKGIKPNGYRWNNIDLSNKDPTDLAYLAGFVDGEGTIGIYSNGWKKNRKNPSRGFRCVFQIVNTNEEIINYIKRFLGTSFITKRDPRDKKENLKNNRPRYILTLSSVQNVGEICKAILPYLKIKKSRAELVLEYCNNRKVRIITDRDIQIVNELKILNKRGRNY